jgi:sulfofructose kinase
VSGVLAVGLCTVDYLGVVDRYPPLDRKEELSTFSIQGGGPAATGAATLANLGIPTRFVSKLGDDALGLTARASLEEAGVDCGGIVVAPGAVSPLSFVAVDGESGKRTVFWTRGSVGRLNADEVQSDLLDEAEVLLIDGHHPDAQLALCLEARRRGIEVVLDAGSHRPGMDELVKVSTVVIASERFGAELAGSVDRAVQALADLGPRCAVVTLGEDGSVGKEGERTELVAPFPVEVVDTTGAGDVYHGAFVYGMLKGWRLRERMEFAGCAAALACRALGGRAGLPSLAEIEEAMNGGAP